MALDFFAGCIGGAAGLICGHPLDTVKVRLQTQSPDNIKYRGTFHALSTIVKQESVPGLFKGIVSPLYGVAAINALVFGVYGTLRPYIAGPPGHDALWAHFLAGAASGSVQSVISSPMELVKIRIQMNEGVTTNSSWNVLKEIFRKEGGLKRGVYKGWTTTLCREIPGFGSYFATYELLTTRTGRDIGTFDMLMAGGMSGVVSWVVTYPTDVVKTRLQMDTVGKYKGIADCIKKIYQNEGIGAFTRGLSPAVLRAFPTNAATFTVVTWIMRLGEERRIDLQTSKDNQTLSGFLEEWNLSQRIYNQQIYQTVNYTMPQPKFLTVQCFLKSSVQLEEQEKLISQFADNLINDKNNNCDCDKTHSRKESKECENSTRMRQSKSQEKLSMINVDVESSHKTSALPPVSNFHLDEGQQPQPDTHEIQNRIENDVEPLLELPEKSIRKCSETDECVCKRSCQL